jgi:hypothetical protein
MAAPRNHSSQDPRVISVFEILASYATETVYHHIYHSAETRRASGSSITDEYVRHIQAYVVGVKNDEQCYGDVIQGIHKFFTATTRFTTLSFAEFVDRVVGVCVPPEYFSQFSSQDKDEILSSAVCDMISSLTAYATSPAMLPRIIDSRHSGAAVTIRMLQDAAVNALVSKRAALHNSFLKKMGQARDHVSMDVVDDMKKALRRLVKEKADAVARAEDAEEALEELRSKLRESKTREVKLRKLVDIMKVARDNGPSAAGASLRIPGRETIAETEGVKFDTEGGRHPAGSVPRRDTIAEETKGGRDEEGGGARAPRGKNRPAPKTGVAGGVPVGFFQMAGAGPGPAQPRQPTGQGAAAMPESSKQPAKSVRPAMFASLLDDVVDADEGDGAYEPLNDDDLDSIIYG